MALTGTRQLRSQGPVPVHAHRTEEVTGSEGRERANGVGSEIGIGGENGDGNRVGGGGGNGDRNGDGDGDGAGTGTGRRVDANEGAQGGNEGGNEDGDGAGTGMGTAVETRGRPQDGNRDGSGDGNKSSSGAGNGDEDGNGDGNEDGIGEGGGKTKKRKKLHKTCRRHVGNGADLAGKREKRRQERFGSGAANPDDLECSKKTAGEHKVLRT